jgi:hypothetical protein
VLRLLRGEALDAVARDSQVPAHELEEWRRVFLDRGTQRLKKRVDPEERELKRVQAKLGEVMMRLELAEGLLEKKDTDGGAAEARPMTTQASPTTGWLYLLTMVCTVFRVPRATMYTQTVVPVGDAPGKRGPHTTGSDADLVAAIRRVLAETPFHSEGHRKVRARLRALGWRVGKNRVLRLMRAHGLLAPQRAGHLHGDPAHAGTIITAAQRYVGNRRHAVLHRAGGLVLVFLVQSTTRAMTSSCLSRKLIRARRVEEGRCERVELLPGIRKVSHIEAGRTPALASSPRDCREHPRKRHS